MHAVVHGASRRTRALLAALFGLHLLIAAVLVLRGSRRSRGGSDPDAAPPNLIL